MKHENNNNKFWLIVNKYGLIILKQLLDIGMRFEGLWALRDGLRRSGSLNSKP